MPCSFPTLAARLGVVLLIASAVPASAAFPVNTTKKLSRLLTIDPRGALIVENVNGSVVVTGQARNNVLLEVTNHVSAVDRTAAAEAGQAAQIAFGGSEMKRAIRTVMTKPPRTAKWSVTVTYVIRVPSSIDVTVSSVHADRIHLSNLSGRVTVKNLRGHIRAHDVTGPARIDAGNGNVTMIYNRRPASNARVTSVNGSVDVRVPKGSSFSWTAETLRGDILTGVPVRGAVQPQTSSRIYSGTVNLKETPRLYTASMTGRVVLAHTGEVQPVVRSLLPKRPAAAARSHSSAAPSTRAVLQQTAASMLVRPPNAKSFLVQQTIHRGDYRTRGGVGNVFIGDVQGNADLRTGAGEIVLGRVRGRCDIESSGGPINLGDVAGPMRLRTAAGDIVVRTARSGGSATTEGGNIHVVFAGGPLQLDTGGGDISVRQANGPVRATTRSGDVGITLDPAARRQEILARTGNGNIILNVNAAFGADVEATIITTDEKAHNVISELEGLSVTREKVGSRTRIRATGRLNGGGAKLELYAEEGSIVIRNRTFPAIVVPAATTAARR